MISMGYFDDNEFNQNRIDDSNEEQENSTQSSESGINWGFDQLNRWEND